MNRPLEPSCHDYVPPREHRFERAPEHDDPFGEAWQCKFCPALDYRFRSGGDS